MEYNHIEHKKPIYRIKAPLKEHLKHYSRLDNLPVSYEDLTEYQELYPLEDDKGKKTLWHMTIYSQESLDFLSKSYKLIINQIDSIIYN